LQGLFSVDEVKSVERANLFFIAGRGGERNFHLGNKKFKRKSYYTERLTSKHDQKRTVHLLHAASLKKKRNFQGILFDVRLSYFTKNRANNTISMGRVPSVLSKHSEDSLKDLDN
jgi:hypothetical protein